MKPVVILSLLAISSTAAWADGPMQPAADPVVAGTSTATASDWGGFYLGGQIGQLSADVANDTFDGNGLTYGLHAGYRADLGTLVLGFEGEIDFSDIDLQVSATGAPVSTTIDGARRAMFNLGYDAGNVLPYLAIGYAWVDASGTDLDGAAYGVGLDYRLNDRVTIGGRFLAHDLEDESGVESDATSISLRASYRF